MGIALIILATVLGLASVASGVQKLRKDPAIVESMHSVGITDKQIPILGLLEILGALGLIVGIWVAPIGVIAALALTLYFLGAVIALIRVKDSSKHAAPAIGLMLLALVTTVLELVR